MIDFLRSNPWCSQEHYMWEMTIPQIKLASFDFSHIEHLEYEEGGDNKNEKKIHTFVIKDDDDVAMLNDLGGKIVFNNNKIRKGK